MAGLTVIDMNTSKGVIPKTISSVPFARFRVHKILGFFIAHFNRGEFGVGIGFFHTSIYAITNPLRQIIFSHDVNKYLVH